MDNPATLLTAIMFVTILGMGIGNLLMGDEGIGVHVVRHLESMSLPDDVACIDGGTGGGDSAPLGLQGSLVVNGSSAGPPALGAPGIDSGT